MSHCFTSASTLWQSRCCGSSQPWEQVADPFPSSLSCLAVRVQPSGGGARVGLFPATMACFSHNTSLPLFSSCQVMFQVGWQSAAHSQRQSRKCCVPVSKKHVLTVCATSGGIFTPQAILLCTLMHNTLDSFYLHTLQMQNIFCSNENTRMGSYVSIGSRIRLRVTAGPAKKTRAGLSLVVPIQKQKVTLWQL